MPSSATSAVAPGALGAQIGFDPALFGEAAPQDRLLFKLRSQSPRSPYARYDGLPLRYPGGKSLAVGQIVERIPRGVRKVVSPFLGGGAVEVACARDLGLEVEAYDVFDVLVAYWQTQLARPGDLAAAILRWEPSRPDYDAVKARLKAHWEGDARIADPLELAAHYWFNHNLSYGPYFLGYLSRLYEDRPRFERLVRKVADFRCEGLSVGVSDFKEVLDRSSGDFLYCDPPYYLGGDSRMFHGIYPSRNFPVHHAGFDHEGLRERLLRHRGGFILSYNDCEQVREWYAAFDIVEVAWQYTLGQGETRIGENRRAADIGHVKESHELLVLGTG